jgi:predicted lipoprotein with Yx(FWY)xxD motif
MASTEVRAEANVTSKARPALLICGAAMALAALGGCGAYAPGIQPTNVADNGAAQPSVDPGAGSAYGAFPDPNTSTIASPTDDPNAISADPNMSADPGTTSDGTNPPPAAPTPPASPRHANSGSGQMSEKRISRMGSVVEDGNGMVLYRYDKDTADPSTSRCTGSCEMNWPPVIVIVKITVINVRGIDSKLLGTVRRSDGRLQLTLAGWPMYRYAGDRKADQWTGQGKGGEWWAFQPNGNRNMTCVPTTAPTMRPSPTGSEGNNAGGDPKHW